MARLLSQRLRDEPGTLRCLATVKGTGWQLMAGTNCWGRV
jgi:hypothetical protein